MNAVSFPPHHEELAAALEHAARHGTLAALQRSTPGEKPRTNPWLPDPLKWWILPMMSRKTAIQMGMTTLRVLYMFLAVLRPLRILRAVRCLGESQLPTQVVVDAVVLAAMEGYRISWNFDEPDMPYWWYFEADGSYFWVCEHGEGSLVTPSELFSRRKPFPWLFLDRPHSQWMTVSYPARYMELKPQFHPTFDYPAYRIPSRCRELVFDPDRERFFLLRVSGGASRKISVEELPGYTSGDDEEWGALGKGLRKVVRLLRPPRSSHGDWLACAREAGERLARLAGHQG